jgi:hypothetical protein
MNKTMIQRLLAVSLLGLMSSAQAYELRSPWISERGPLTYVFENDKEDRYSLNLWNALYSREAHKAYKKHSTKTKELTALYFGKDNFRLSEAFENSVAPLASENYIPAIRLARLTPRAQYNESGITFGGRFEYPVWGNKGRIGLRAAIPFRCIEIEREDFSGVPGNGDTEDILVTTITSPPPANPGEALSPAIAIRLDALEALRQSSSLNSFVNYHNAAGAAGRVRMTGHSVDVGFPQPATPPAIDINQSVNLLYSPSGIPPQLAPNDARLDINVPGNLTALKALPVTGVVAADSTLRYIFDRAVDYTNLADEANITVAQRLAVQAAKETLWVLDFRDDNNVGPNTVLGDAAQLGIGYLQFLTENAYAWLHDHGVDFNSERRTGLGDIDIDFFYEHRFCKEVIMEAMFGIRIPTSTSDNYVGNPYRPNLGNGNHVELKLGAMVAYQPADWINMKLDMYYSFALENTEHRPAAFKGAQIYGLGPKADAKVDWGYFVGRLDFNMFHPKTKSLSSTIGYELYAKQKDHVRFKQETIESWLGRTLDTNPTSPTFNQFVENLQTLDNGVAEMHTDRIAHRFRGEAAYRFSKYFEMFLGGVFTFAGKNAPRETDYHGGFRVTF